MAEPKSKRQKHRGIFRETDRTLGALKSSMRPVATFPLTVFSFCLWVAWFLATVMTDLFFGPGANVIQSCLFTTAGGAGFAGGALVSFLYRPRKKPLAETNCKPGLFERRTMTRRFYRSCALAASATLGSVFLRIFVLEFSQSASTVAFAAAGILVGLSFHAFMQTAASLFAHVGHDGLMPLGFTIFAGASIALIAVSWLVSVDKQAFAWILTLTASAILYHAGAKNKPARFAALSSNAETPPSRNPLLHEPTKKEDAFVVLLIVLSSFLLGFLIGMFPLTLHFAGSLKPAAVGSMSNISLLTVFAILVTQAIASIIVLQPNFPIAPSLLLAMILFAITCLTVPSLSVDNSLPFATLIPTPVIAALLASQLLACRLTSLKPYFNAEPEMMKVAFLAGLAFFAATALSSAHIVLLDSSGRSYLQQIPIVYMLTALAISILFVIVLLRRPLMQLFFPAMAFNQPLDMSSLENRCQVIADSYDLTKREREILELLCAGRNGPYIQNALHISQNTFKTHSTHIYRKLGISSKQMLIDMVFGNPPLDRD